MVGVGEDVAGAVTLTAVPGTALATTAMGIMAMAMVTMAMETVITGMAIRMDRPAGILPGHPIQADTQVGMPGQPEDLRVVNLAEPESLADTVGIWPQQDIRADQPPLGGVNLVRRQRDMPPREQHPDKPYEPSRNNFVLGTPNGRGSASKVNIHVVGSRGWPVGSPAGCRSVFKLLGC